jgi:hypothetical protein
MQVFFFDFTFKQEQNKGISSRRKIMRIHIARPHFHVPFVIELVMLVGVLALAAVAAHEILGFILQELMVLSDTF